LITGWPSAYSDWALVLSARVGDALMFAAILLIGISLLRVGSLTRWAPLYMKNPVLLKDIDANFWIIVEVRYNLANYRCSLSLFGDLSLCPP
jgi:hypothetical protein